MLNTPRLHANSSTGSRLNGSGVVVRAGGALTYSEVDEQSERDLVSMESIAIPVSFVALVWVFGGVLAAALPMMIGMFAILGSLAVLRFITLFTDVRFSRKSHRRNGFGAGGGLLVTHREPLP